MLPLGRKNAKKCSECGITCHSTCTHFVPDFCGMSNERINQMLALIKSSQSNRRPPTVRQVQPQTQTQAPPGYGAEPDYYQQEKQQPRMGSPSGQLDLVGGYPAPGGYAPPPTGPASPPRQQSQPPTAMYPDQRYGQMQGSMPLTGSPQQQYPTGLPSGPPPRPPPPPGHQQRMSSGSAGVYQEQQPYGMPPGGRGPYDQQPQPGYSVSSPLDIGTPTIDYMVASRAALSSQFPSAVTIIPWDRSLLIDMSRHPLGDQANPCLGMDNTLLAKSRSLRKGRHSQPGNRARLDWTTSTFWQSWVRETSERSCWLRRKGLRTYTLLRC